MRSCLRTQSGGAACSDHKSFPRTTVITCLLYGTGKLGRNNLSKAIIMGKDGGFLTAKAISKRIKAKGLGRLRWYCQMCEKQCRDENGFKCHTQSAGHQRQLALFSENPHEFISNFSTAFRREFLSILCQRYGTRMVNANTVYQEYIKDKEHVHMNATQWTTLSDFVKDLGKEGLCKVQDREDGFWISFVDREVAERDRMARERDTQLLEEEHRSERILQRQLRHAAKVKARAGDSHDDDDDRIEWQDNAGFKDQPNTHNGPLNFKISANRTFTKSSKGASAENVLKSLTTSRAGDGLQIPKKRKSRWDIVNPKDPAPKATQTPLNTNISHDSRTLNISNSDNTEPSEPGGPWLMKDIVVKIKNAEVGNGTFVGKKGRVVDVIDEYGARLAIIDSSAVLELDQDDLETVIPKAGGMVLILTGKHRGKKAIVQSINVDDFSVTVSLADGGERLHSLEYECVSRLFS